MALHTHGSSHNTSHKKTNTHGGTHNLEEETGIQVMREFDHLASLRGNWEGHWQEIAERIFTMQSLTFHRNHELSIQGQKKTTEMFDSTGARALGKFAAILDSLLTPRNQTWHRLLTNVPDLNKDRGVRLFFEETNRLLFKHRYAPNANFTSQNQLVYKGLGAYGTACMFVDELAGPERGLRYKNIHIGEIYFAENHQGIVDKAYRRFAVTARQAMQRWGDRNPEKIRNALKDKPEQVFYVVHRVKPNENRDPNRVDFAGMPFTSHYVTEQDKTVVQIGGFTSFPYAVPRHEQAPNEIYGRSPAMETLPDIKTLNEMKKTMLKQGHRTVDPVLLAHDDGIVDTFSLLPGSIHGGGVNAQGRPLVHPLPIGNVTAGFDLMEAERVSINDAFLVTLFQILTETPTMTATEVLERTKEKGILLAPTIGRQQSEYLGPMIERELDLLEQQSLIPALPPALIEAQGEYRIEYASPLTRAQRAEEASGTLRSLELAIKIAAEAGNPEALDHFDFDKIIPGVSDIQGMPVSWLRSAESIQQIRDDRQQQQEIQQLTEAGPSLAAVAKQAS